jgi:predicted Fe-Mo cluster-binding NifX family protein
MKIAVSAQESSLDSQVDPRFGRTKGFVLYDTETDQTSFLNNADQQNLAQGAGIQTAQMIHDAGTDILITGQIGPKAMQALSQTPIKLYACPNGTVREAIDAWQANQLQPIIPDAAGPASGAGGGRGMGGGGGGLGRGPAQGGRGMGGGARGQGPGMGGRGMGGGRRRS